MSPTDDVTSTFGYNFAGHVNLTRPYAVNGLNRYTSAGPAAFTYDANGDGATIRWSNRMSSSLLPSCHNRQ